MGDTAHSGGVRHGPRWVRPIGHSPRETWLARADRSRASDDPSDDRCLLERDVDTLDRLISRGGVGLLLSRAVRQDPPISFGAGDPVPRRPKVASSSEVANAAPFVIIDRLPPVSADVVRRRTSSRSPLAAHGSRVPAVARRRDHARVPGLGERQTDGRVNDHRRARSFSIAIRSTPRRWPTCARSSVATRRGTGPCATPWPPCATARRGR